MTWEIFGSLVAFFAMMLGYITWFEKRRDKKAEERAKKVIEDKETLEKEIKDGLCDDMKGCIHKELEPYVLKTDDLDMHRQILDELKKLDVNIKAYQEDMHEAILERLQGEIIQFSEDLKNGSKKSSVAYEHIHNSYRKYKQMGGNGYIDGMFKYIEKVQNREDDKNEVSK